MTVTPVLIAEHFDRVERVRARVADHSVDEFLDPYRRGASEEGFSQRIIPDLPRRDTPMTLRWAWWKGDQALSTKSWIRPEIVNT
jgi:hypothetical protein